VVKKVKTELKTGKDIFIFLLFAMALLSTYLVMERDQTILYIFLALFLVYSFISLLVSRKFGAEIMGWPGIVKSRDYTSLFLAVPQAGLIFSVVMVLYNGMYGVILLVAGFTLMFIGMAFNLMVRRELGKNWVPLSKTTDNQELITRGIYSKVRHPFYLSILILFLGVAIISWNILGLVFFILFIIGLVFRIKKEEKELIFKFGQQYTDYMDKTPMLIPAVFK
jgi:protein-S-isoprenylcysteine O-methyltransferase Ste14